MGWVTRLFSRAGPQRRFLGRDLGAQRGVLLGQPGGLGQGALEAGFELVGEVGLAGLSTAEALRYVDVDMAEPNRSRISHLWKICSVLASTSVGMSVAGRSGPAGNATLAGTQRPRSSGLTTTMSQESWCGAQHFFFRCVTATACGGLSPVGALATNR